MRFLKQELRIFHAQHFSNVHLARELWAELEEKQADLLGNRMDESLLLREIDLTWRLHEASTIEEAQLRQKSRVLWLKEGIKILHSSFVLLKLSILRRH